MIEKRVPKTSTKGNRARHARSIGVGRKGVFRGVVVGIVVLATPFGEAAFAARRVVAILVV